MLTLYFNKTEKLEEYINWYYSKTNRLPRVTAKLYNGKIEYITKVNLEDRD